MARHQHSALLWRAVVALTYLVSASRCFQMTSWSTENGTFIAYQSPGKASISYSYCNTGHEVTLPEGAANTLDVVIPPKIGTSLAGAGGHGGPDEKIWAVVFYQSDLNQIVEVFYLCNMQTGLYERFSNRIIQDSAYKPLQVSATTGLAVVFSRRDDNDIYHLFYKDMDYTIRQITWSSASRDFWSMGELSGASVTSYGIAMDAAYSKSMDKNFVLTAKVGTAKVQITREVGDGTWCNAELPKDDDIAIPFWSGDPKSLGLTVDKQGNQTVYYIGTDNRLHRIIIDSDSRMHIPEHSMRRQKKPHSHHKGYTRPDVTPFNGGPDSSLAIAAQPDSSEAYIFWQNNDGGLSGLHFADDQLTPANPVITDPSIDSGDGNVPTATPTATESGIQAFPTSNGPDPSNEGDTKKPIDEEEPSAPAAATPTADCGTDCEQDPKRYTGVVVGCIFGIIAAVCLSITGYFVWRRWRFRRAERRRFQDWRPSPNAERIRCGRWATLGDISWLHETKNTRSTTQTQSNSVPMGPVAGAAAAGGVVTGASVVAATADMPAHYAPQAETVDEEVSPVSAPRASMDGYRVSPTDSMVSLPRISEEQPSEVKEQTRASVDLDRVSRAGSTPSLTPSLNDTVSDDESYDGEARIAQIGIAL